MVSELYGRVNLLMNQFGHCAPLIRYKLFTAYCDDFYGSNLLNFNRPDVNELFVAWRKCTRRVLGLHPRTHCRLLPLIGNDVPLATKLHNKLYKFLVNSLSSGNSLIHKCAHIALSNYPNCMIRNISVLCREYGVPRYMLETSGCFKMLVWKPDHTAINTSNTIREFLNMNTDDPIDRENINYIIEDLCIY